ncbi:MAG TPA: prepilin-type N-terminal cleavage/methylation domain-containing protein [Longimicrobiaceae bacterium]
MRNIRGFTLIELMIVVVIIGILASLAIPAFGRVTRNAKEAEAGPYLKQIVTLQERYRAAHADYTLDITQLEGGTTLGAGGTYFTYSIVAHGTGYCAVATPNAAGVAADLMPQSVDAEGNFYESANCS